MVSGWVAFLAGMVGLSPERGADRGWRNRLFNRSNFCETGRRGSAASRLGSLRGSALRRRRTHLLLEPFEVLPECRRRLGGGQADGRRPLATRRQEADARRPQQPADESVTDPERQPGGALQGMDRRQGGEGPPRGDQRRPRSEGDRGLAGAGQLQPQLALEEAELLARQGLGVVDDLLDQRDQIGLALVAVGFIKSRLGSACVWRAGQGSSRSSGPVTTLSCRTTTSSGTTTSWARRSSWRPRPPSPRPTTSSGTTTSSWGRRLLGACRRLRVPQADGLGGRAERVLPTFLTTFLVAFLTTFASAAMASPTGARAFSALRDDFLGRLGDGVRRPLQILLDAHGPLSRGRSPERRPRRPPRPSSEPRRRALAADHGWVGTGQHRHISQFPCRIFSFSHVAIRCDRTDHDRPLRDPARGCEPPSKNSMLTG